MLQATAMVVDTTRSPHTRLRPVSLTAVSLDDPFWSPRLRINREVSLPAQYRLLEETGRIDNVRRAAGKIDLPFQGRFYNDSDVYKWLEGVAWSLATHPDPGLARMANAVIAEIIDAQRLEGYLNTYFVFDRAGDRWTNLRDMHELYCAGHLIQAAIAHRRATSSPRLMEVARRLADHIVDTFGPASEGRPSGVPGHPGIEMALVELARETGTSRYLRQAQAFLDARGQGLIGGSPYHQDHQPFRDIDRMVGHAVRALYLNAGATDLYAETGEPALRAALDRLWSSMTARQIYLSGGLGARYAGEAFGDAYELPNARAYAETCAAIGSVMWNARLLALEGDARYADLLETSLYNAVLPGLALDGQTYFYQNPLSDAGTHRRQAWFECACCPTNVVRLLASLPGYVYAVSERGIWVHLYAASTAQIALPEGRSVGLAQHTHYPWEADIKLEVDGEGPFSLHLRIPAWCEEGAWVEVNGEPHPGTPLPGTYVELHREWSPGDVVHLQLPMPVRRVRCHPYVAENAGRVALMRGPLLYCVEGVDHPGLDLRDIRLADGAPISAVHRPALLGGVVVLHAPAWLAPPAAAWEGRLYRTVASHSDEAVPRSVELMAIPYYAWANRQPGRMQVWLPQASRAEVNSVRPSPEGRNHGE